MSLTAGQYTVATDGTHIATDGVKRYVALLTQAGTDAPVATVLENSLGGALVWSRSGAGTYHATLAGAFPAGKVFTTPDPYAGYYNQSLSASFTLFRIDGDTLELADSSTEDDHLFSLQVRIKVYP
jgi:hypothetical protein